MPYCEPVIWYYHFCVDTGTVAGGQLWICWGHDPTSFQCVQQLRPSLHWNWHSLCPCNRIWETPAFSIPWIRDHKTWKKVSSKYCHAQFVSCKSNVTSTSTDTDWTYYFHYLCNSSFSWIKIPEGSEVCKTTKIVWNWSTPFHSSLIWCRIQHHCNVNMSNFTQ
jgi:hypothetical protein